MVEKRQGDRTIRDVLGNRKCSRAISEHALVEGLKMNRREVIASANSLPLKCCNHSVAIRTIELVSQPDNVDEPTDHRVWLAWSRRDDFGDFAHRFVIKFGYLSAR